MGRKKLLGTEGWVSHDGELGHQMKWPVPSLITQHIQLSTVTIHMHLLLPTHGDCHQKPALTCICVVPPAPTNHIHSTVTLLKWVSAYYHAKGTVRNIFNHRVNMKSVKSLIDIK